MGENCDTPFSRWNTISVMLSGNFSEFRRFRITLATNSFPSSSSHPASASTIRSSTSRSACSSWYLLYRCNSLQSTTLCPEEVREAIPIMMLSLSASRLSSICTSDTVCCNFLQISSMRQRLKTPIRNIRFIASSPLNALLYIQALFLSPILILALTSFYAARPKNISVVLRRKMLL